jgi:hypothetical protein
LAFATRDRGGNTAIVVKVLLTKNLNGRCTGQEWDKRQYEKHCSPKRSPRNLRSLFNWSDNMHHTSCHVQTWESTICSVQLFESSLIVSLLWKKNLKATIHSRKTSRCFSALLNMVACIILWMLDTKNSCNPWVCTSFSSPFWVLLLPPHLIASTSLHVSRPYDETFQCQKWENPSSAYAWTLAAYDMEIDNPNSQLCSYSICHDASKEFLSALPNGSVLTQKESLSLVAKDDSKGSANNVTWQFVNCPWENGSFYIYNTRTLSVLDTHGDGVSCWNNNGATIDQIVNGMLMKRVRRSCIYIYLLFSFHFHVHLYISLFLSSFVISSVYSIRKHFSFCEEHPMVRGRC